MLIMKAEAIAKDMEDVRKLVAKNLIDEIDMTSQDDLAAMALLNRITKNFNSYLYEEAVAIDMILMKLCKMEELLESKEKES